MVVEITRHKIVNSVSNDELVVLLYIKNSYIDEIKKLKENTFSLDFEVKLKPRS